MLDFFITVSLCFGYGWLTVLRCPCRFLKLALPEILKFRWICIWHDHMSAKVFMLNKGCISPMLSSALHGMLTLLRTVHSQQLILEKSEAC